MNLVKRYVANMLLCILKKATSLCTFGVLSALQLFNVPQLQKLRKICMNLQLWPNTSHWLSWNILSWWLDSISSSWACASLLQPIQVRILTNFYCVRGHEALVGCRRYSLLFFHLVPATWEGMFLDVFGISPKNVLGSALVSSEETGIRETSGGLHLLIWEKYSCLLGFFLSQLQLGFCQISLHQQCNFPYVHHKISVNNISGQTNVIPKHELSRFCRGDSIFPLSLTTICWEFPSAVSPAPRSQWIQWTDSWHPPQPPSPWT